jgi:hypothetical protein
MMSPLKTDFEAWRALKLFHGLPETRPGLAGPDRRLPRVSNREDSATGL